jgi:hypothetical protein
MLPPFQEDLTLAQGDTLMILAAVVEDAFGAPVSDATGWRLVVAVKARLCDPDSAALLHADGGNQTISGNILQQSLGTASLGGWARLVYDARLIDPAGRVFRYQYGNLFITEPVTDSPSTL